MIDPIVFFPGCMPASIARHQYRAEQKILKKLDIPYHECPEFSCCGGGHLQDADDIKFLALNARNLAYAEQHGDVLVTGCSTCYRNMAETAFRLQNERLRTAVNARLDAVGAPEYQGKIRIRHMLNFLASPEIFSLLEEQTSSPRPVNVLPFYGCHIKRPSSILPENPDGNMEKLLTLCGYLVRPMRDPYTCCGFHGEITAPSVSQALSAAVSEEAVEQQCPIIATVCPLCSFNIESHQMRNKTKRKMPEIIPFEELLLTSLK